MSLDSSLLVYPYANTVLNVNGPSIFLFENDSGRNLGPVGFCLTLMHGVGTEATVGVLTFTVVFAFADESCIVKQYAIPRTNFQQSANIALPAGLCAVFANVVSQDTANNQLPVSINVTSITGSFIES